MNRTADVKQMRAQSLDKRQRCPACPECDWVRRSRFQWQDLLFLPFGLRPYRCLQCWHRFYVFRGEMRSSLQGRKETR
jgi:hypothetical protein